MKMHISHRFDCSAQRLWDLVLDADYQAAVDTQSGLSRELISERKSARELIRKIRFTPDKTLPPAMARAVGRDKMSYVQEQRWKLSELKMFWTVVPDVMGDRVRSKGDFQLRAVGAEQVERIVSGEITASIPLMGGRVEKMVVADIEKGYERTAELTRSWLLKHS
ncbi:MAG: hypothetical protein ACI9VR_005381 [Cognaticolwellia sp.]|jgi:hypothetical protein